MDNVLFNPVMCSSETFKKQAAKDGFVYFVTDTKQIYVARDGKFVELCGGINLVYGKKEITYSNSGKDPDPNVFFYYSDLEDKDNAPLVNDLILNKDGCFYRVKSVTSSGIQTERLTLQGTGSGGSGGGSGSSGGSTSYYLDILNSNYVFPSTTEKMEVGFKANYAGEKMNYIKRVSFTIDGEDQPFYSKSGQFLAMETEHYVDLTAYKNKFGSTSKTVIIKTVDNYGNERDERFTITVVTLQLVGDSNYADSISYVTAKTFNYSYTFSGAENLAERKLVFKFYNEASRDTAVRTVEVDAKVGSNQSASVALGDLEAGAYSMKVYGIGPVGGQDLTSNTVSQTLVYFPDGTKGSILGIQIPDKIEQYVDISFKFLICSDSQDTQTVSMRVNNKLYDTVSIAPNVVGEFSYYFDVAQDYTLAFETSSGLSKTATITVVPYESDLPIIDPSDNNLLLYLTPRGHTNDSINRGVWNDSSLKGAAAYGYGNGVLSGFYYGSTNGWLKEKDGTPYLKLSSGATFELKDFEPFKYDPTETSRGNDWQQNKMGYGMTIELDFEINGVTDYDKNIIECVSYPAVNAKPSVGFHLSGNKVEVYSSEMNGSKATVDDDGNLIDNTILPRTIVEGKRTRISYVIEPKSSKEEDFPMALVYINGIQSGATIYSPADKFLQSSSLPATIKIMSESAQVKIFGIRIYATALDDDMILKNYTASLSTLSKRQANYDDTNIFDAFGEIDYEKVSAENYNLGIPYMLLTGGYPTETETNKWQLKTGIDKSTDIHLPTGKKDYRLVDIEIYYPDTDYFKTGLGAGLANKVVKYKNEFENGLSMSENLGKQPVKGGYIVYGQGTSSMEYPVKNLRLRANKKATDELFQVRPAIGDLEIICMKADYMDSSGSHNTGTANLVDDCYKAIGLQTPGQKHYDPEKTGSIVTCIKGYPCIIFYREDENSKYKFVGKYNMNLDKATPEPFGFMPDEADNFGYVPVGATYYDSEGNLKTAVDGDKINAIHCFEFLDNATEVCNFSVKEGAEDYRSTWYKQYQVKEGEEKQWGWTLGFESRYPEDETGAHDADVLYPLASWLNELQTLREKEEKGDSENPPLTPNDIVQNITYKQCVQGSVYNNTNQYYIESVETPGTYEKSYPNEKQFNENPTTYWLIDKDESVFKMQSLQRFKDEYEEYFNKDFLLTYYVLTEALLMVDSRVKNLMLATWGPEKKSDGSYTKNHIFYPIFYDMDTMLGLDNAGKERFTYSDLDDDGNVYNGDCVLWNFVRDALAYEVNIQYNKLETAGPLKPSNVIDYYNKYQANMANEAFYNGDAQYKYVRPAIEGYDDDLGNKHIAPGDAPYLYAGQGNRDMTREYFIKNRLSFLRGKHVTDAFTTAQAVEFRWNYPTKSVESNPTALDKSIEAVPPTGDFEFTSMQTCYAGVQLGKNASGVQSEKFTGQETKTITVPNANKANGTEAYLLGVNNLSDMGDLSSKYVQKFAFTDTSENIKLKKIILGNSRQGYNNTFWSGSQAISLTGCTYIEEFDLRNCPLYTKTISFEPCLAIKKILLTGSGTTSVTLPKNGNLIELRLPPMTKLSIESHPNLKQFSMGTYNYKTTDLKEEMTDESRYVENYKELTSVEIIDTPIDSYKMLCNAPLLESFNIHGFNWEITEDNIQYIPTKDAAAIPDKTYYYWDASAEDYVSCKGTWNGIAKGYMLEAVTMLDNDKNITCIPLLDRLISKAGSEVKDKLSGIITISIADASANEYAIYEKYHAVLPSVTIKYSGMSVTEANKLRFYNLDSFPTFDEIENDTYNTFYEVLFDSKLEESNRNLKWLASASGPNGTALPTPTKMSTTDTVFTYGKKWKMKKVGEYDSQAVEVDPTTDVTVLEGDYVLIPVYNTSVRKYTVTFHNYDGSKHSDVKYQYQWNYMQNTSTPLIVDKPSTGLKADERWQFMGWISEGDYNSDIGHEGNLTNPKYYDMETDIVEVDGLQLYPYFEKQDCRITPSPDKWFEFTNAVQVTYTYAKYNTTQVQDATEAFNLGSGRELAFKEAYIPWLPSKITIPSSINGIEVRAFAGRSSNDALKCANLEEVYFMNDTNASNCQALGQAAFSSCENLQKVVLPKSLVYMSYHVFEDDKKLKVLENFEDNTNIQYISQGVFKNARCPSKLPNNLKGIGWEAFYGVKPLDDNDSYISNIPAGVAALGTQTFMSACCDLWVIGNNGTISGDDNGLEYLGSAVFSSCVRKNKNSTLRLGKSIKYLYKDNNNNSTFYNAFNNCTYNVEDYTSLIHSREDFVNDYANGNPSGNLVTFDNKED